MLNPRKEIILNRLLGVASITISLALRNLVTDLHAHPSRSVVLCYNSAATKQLKLSLYEQLTKLSIILRTVGAY